MENYFDPAKYIIARTGEVDPKTVKDLRELDIALDPGCVALFSDAASSIVAFAFDRAIFDGKKIDAFVKQFTSPRRIKALAAAERKERVRVLGRKAGLGLTAISR